MTLMIAVNKRQICNVAFINVINKVAITKVFTSIVIVSNLTGKTRQKI